MKIFGKKASDYFPQRLRSVARRLGLEANRVRNRWYEVLLSVRTRLGGGILHVRGPETFDFGPESLIVLCKFRNGEPWLDAFLAYYKRMGVDRIVLIDNGSTDASREIIAAHDDVSLLETDLPHSKYWVPTKRWLVKNLGRDGCWCLLADVDELFDYPYSSRLDLHGFIGYLNRNGYSAVSVQNLEMVADAPLLELQGRDRENLEIDYPYYDVSAITRSRDIYWIEMNRLDSEEHYSHGGGIRETGFGWNGSMLTRHALVRNDKKIDLYPYDSHFVTGARLADVTTLFRHYKFIGSFVDHMRDAIAHAQHHDSSRIFHRYAEVLRGNPDLNLIGSNSKVYRRAEDLVDAGFLIASPRYRSFVEAAASGNRNALR